MRALDVSSVDHEDSSRPPDTTDGLTLVMRQLRPHGARPTLAGRSATMRLTRVVRTAGARPEPAVPERSNFQNVF